MKDERVATAPGEALRAAAVGAAVFLAASLSYLLMPRPGIAAIWMPAGVLLGLLVRLEPRRWPGFLAGAYLGNVAADLNFAAPVTLSFTAPAVNAAESALAAWVVRRFSGTAPRLATPRDVIVLVAGAAGVANAVTAILGGVALHAAYGTGLLRNALVWWVGDGLGMLLVAPAFWALVPTRAWGLTAMPVSRRVEALVLLLSGLALGVLVFWVTPGFADRLHPSLYMAFPHLLWVALRFGAPGAVAGNLVLAGLVLLGARQAIGPFGEHPASALHNGIEIYVLIAVAALTSLISAAIVEQRQTGARGLAAAEERYRQLFDSSPEAMWVYDVETLRFLAVNETAIRRYGWSREEFLARTLRDIRPLDEQERLSRALEAGPEALFALHAVRHRTRAGELLDVEVSGHDLGFEGHRARLIVARDVTERRRLETQLREAQRLEAIGQLAAGIAHDFGNLLQVIVTNSELAAATLPPDHPGHDDLDHVRQAADRAGELRRQLLAYGRRQPMEEREIGPAALVGGVHGLLRQLVGRDVALTVDIPATLGPLRVDPGQMEQVLVNLVVNARDAMPRGGRVAITARPAELDAAEAIAHAVVPGQYVALAVRDDGTGMDAATRARIFEPYFTTKGDRGTGLGLAMVDGIVRQSGGFVTVESRPGAGSTFTVWLPRVAG